MESEGDPTLSRECVAYSNAGLRAGRTRTQRVPRATQWPSDQPLHLPGRRVRRPSRRERRWAGTASCRARALRSLRCRPWRMGLVKAWLVGRPRQDAGSTPLDRSPETVLPQVPVHSPTMRISRVMPGSSYLDRTAQRVAVAAPLGAEVLEASALTVLPGGLQPPSRLERAENDCVTRIYAQSRRQVPRERAVKRLSTWFYDMHRHSYPPPQRTREV